MRISPSGDTLVIAEGELADQEAKIGIWDLSTGKKTGSLHCQSGDALPFLILGNCVLPTMQKAFI